MHTLDQKIVIYQTEDGKTQIDVRLENETVWLTQAQMAELFEKDQSVVARHINNAFKEGELEKESNMQFLHNTQYKYRPTRIYDLDTIICVGYRVSRGDRYLSHSSRHTQVPVPLTNPGCGATCEQQTFPLHQHQAPPPLAAHRQQGDQLHHDSHQREDQQRAHLPDPLFRFRHRSHHPRQSPRRDPKNRQRHGLHLSRKRVELKQTIIMKKILLIIFASVSALAINAQDSEKMNFNLGDDYEFLKEYEKHSELSQPRGYDGRFEYEVISLKKKTVKLRGVLDDKQKVFDKVPAVCNIVFPNENDHINHHFQFKVAMVAPAVLQYSSNFEEVTLASQFIEEVPSKLFEENTNLEKVVIKGKFKTISSDIFIGCTNLKYLYISPNVKKILPSAFIGAENLKGIHVFWTNSVDLPELNNAFNADVLKNAVLYVPKGSSNIYKESDYWKAFANIKEETNELEPTIGNHGDYIEYKHSDNTSGKVEIPSPQDVNGTSYPVGEIGESAFENNTKLTSVTIPSSVNYIGANAFKGCSNMSEVHCENPIPPLLVNSNEDSPARTRAEVTVSQFEGVDMDNCVLYVPIGSSSTYKKYDGWKDFKIIIEEDSKSTAIKAIYNNSPMEEDDLYNLKGQRVNVPQKGIYIRNGKKVIIK